MYSINAAIKTKFHFLEEAHGFARADCHSNDVTFVNGNISVQFLYNDRDGFDALILDGDAAISLLTVLGALRTYRGDYDEGMEDDESSAAVEQQIEDLAAFLRGDGGAILSAGTELMNDLKRLRFWHVGHWCSEWGQSIKLSKEEIEENRALVPRIESMLRGCGR